MAAEPVMRRLLEVLDDFELALMHADREARLRAVPARRGARLREARWTRSRPRGSSGSTREGKPFDPVAARGADADGRGRRRAGRGRRAAARLHAEADACSVPPACGSNRGSDGDDDRERRRGPPGVVRQGLLPGPRCAQERVGAATSRRRTASSRRSSIPTRTPATSDAEERFKEISAAYDVLGDEEKRDELRPRPRDGRVRVRRRASGRRRRAPAGPAGWPGRRAATQTVDVDLGDLLGGMFGGARPARGRGGRGPPRGAPTSRPRSGSRSRTR